MNSNVSLVHSSNQFRVLILSRSNKYYSDYAIYFRIIIHLLYYIIVINYHKKQVSVLRPSFHAYILFLVLFILLCFVLKNIKNLR